MINQHALLHSGWIYIYIQCMCIYLYIAIKFGGTHMCHGQIIWQKVLWYGHPILVSLQWVLGIISLPLC